MKQSMQVLLRTAILVGSLVAFGAAASAQTNAASVAATLQSWRDFCSDPNPDLAFGYLVEAVQTGSPDIRKVCLRQVLMAENVDLQNAALRLTMASAPMVRFRITGEIKAKSNSEGLMFRHLVAGLVFQGSQGDTQAGTAVWRPVVDTPTPRDKSTGKMAVFGRDIHWAGTLHVGSQAPSCALAASLIDGARIVGALSCDGGTPIPMESNIFD